MSLLTKHFARSVISLAHGSVAGSDKIELGYGSVAGGDKIELSPIATLVLIFTCLVFFILFAAVSVLFLR